MADHRALTVQCQTEAAALCSDVNFPPSQNGADLTRSRNNVVSLIQAMYSQFSWRQLQLCKVPGFGPYTDVTLTFDLLFIYEGILRADLEASEVLSYCLS